VIKEVIAKLVEGENLKQADAYVVMKEIMEGAATPSQIAGFLVALRNKGETADEIAGCALAMRDSAQMMALTPSLIVDSCGTGGDGQGGLNVSTAASFVVAGAGFTVAKHGNRSISSKCGSADVLEALGVRVDPPSFVVEQSINTIGIGFMFAPEFHPAMRHAMPTRKELGIRTIFNMLGPLTNPARASVQLIGVYKEELTGMIANVLAKMGHKAGLVVHSHGWDEITLDGPTHVAEMIGRKVKRYKLTHKDFGLPKVAVKHLKGADAEGNAAAIRQILEGKKTPARDVIAANAAALIWITERATGEKSFSLKEAVARAQQSIDSGEAARKMRAMAELSRTIEV
jgi:anthranilate phosphoribosyltransferase